MEAYDLQKAALRFTGLVEELTNWYIRRSRRRFWKSQDDCDKREAYETLHYVLVTFTRLAAPFIPFVTECMYRNLRTDAMPESVHLDDYPSPSSGYRNVRLEQRMHRTMTAVSLGRSLRTQAGLRVRQPLRAAVLVAVDPEVRGDLEAMREVIAEELNVKAVYLHADEEELVELSVKANFKRLGPRLGNRMRAAGAAIAALSPAAIQQLRRGEVLKLDIGADDPVALELQDVIVQRAEKPGLTVANEGEITVALDTGLDDDLRREGWAREIVSRLQNLRKETGLDVTDRIEVRYRLPAAGKEAVVAFADYICSETLAVKMLADEAFDAPELEINGEPCRFAIAVCTDA